MDINSKIYADIEIPSINKKGFLEPTDLYALEILEVAGTSPAGVYMSFKTFDEEIMKGIIEDNEVLIKLGESEKDADTFSVTIYAKNKPSASTGSSGGTGWIVSFTGFINGKSFIYDTQSEVYSGDSLAVAKKVVEDAYGKGKFKSNILKVNEKPNKQLSSSELYKAIKDQVSSSLTSTGTVSGAIDSYLEDVGLNWSELYEKVMEGSPIPATKSGNNNNIDWDEIVSAGSMIWMRRNQSARTFLIETILHMDIMPSFPMCAFDKYGNFILRSFTALCKGGAKYNFVAGTPKKLNDIQYYENFQVKDYRDLYNIFCGYNRLVEVPNATTGKTKPAFNNQAPLLASSKITEKSRSGSTVTANRIQSCNVHSTYMEAYAHNTNKLMALGVLAGSVELKGRYYRTLAPLDLINLNAGDSKDAEAINGLWIVEAISTHTNFSAGCIETTVMISRDNYNYLENSVKKEGLLTILKKWMNKISAAIHDFKVAYAQLRRIMDGTFLEEMRSFMVATKTNLLRSFSVLGVTVDFNSSAKLLQSLICVGNSLMNTLVDMVFPEAIANLLRDFIILKPSLMNLVSNFIAEYVPFEVRDIVSILFNSLFNVTDSLNSIAKDNGITVTTNMATQGEAAELTTTETSEINYTENNQERISEIIEDFEEKTKGLDIPFPIIELNESQSLLSDEELKNYVATVTIENLTNLGYITTEADEEELKEILEGNQNINFELIKRINKNAGNSYNYRFWGTFGSDKEAMYAWKFEDNVVYTKSETITAKTRLYNSDYSPYARIEFQVVKTGTDTYVIKYNDNLAERDESLDVISNALAELTSFEIKKSYKDKYRTVPCTKMINASGNRRIYFACPQAEEDLRFYINAKRMQLESFPIDLGYVNSAGNKILYNVYYTSSGYNSTSVMFEVKKGGMV